MSSQTEIRVRFSEVDAMQVVWHGEYARYFEDGREAFGHDYPGLGYMDMYLHGVKAPVVDLQMQYLCPLAINDTATVDVRYIETVAAKLCFEYEIRRKADNKVAARGRSIQVFVANDGTLCLTDPPFYQKWKEKWLRK